MVVVRHMASVDINHEGQSRFHHWVNSPSSYWDCFCWGCLLGVKHEGGNISIENDPPSPAPHSDLEYAGQDSSSRFDSTPIICLPRVFKRH